MFAGFFFFEFPYLHKKNNLQRAVLEKYLKVNLQFIFYLFFFLEGVGLGEGVDYISFSQANIICIVHSEVSSVIKLLYLPSTIQSIVWLFVFKLVKYNVIV